MSFEFAEKTALVTGASSGIGAEFARQLAGLKCNLILVARRQETLEESARQFREEHGIDVEVIAADLTSREELSNLIETVRNRSTPLDLLINNAGCGRVASIEQTSSEEVLRIVDLNIHALTELTYAFLPSMLERDAGVILNVASVVAYQPVVFMGAYAASKAYVLNLTEALQGEIDSSSHVRVIALCPGTTKTEFFDAAGAEDWLSRFQGLRPEFVVEKGIEAVRKGRRVSVPGLKYWLMTFMPRLLPRSWMLRLSRELFRKTVRESAR